MMKKKLIFTALAAGMLCLLALSLLARWSSPTFDLGSPLDQPAPNAAPISADALQTASQPTVAPRLDANLPPAARELAALMAAPVSLRDGGATREFQLSTAEVFLRVRNGAPKIVSLSASDSPQAFAAALEKLRAEEASEPELILYPSGFPQNEHTRRIATRDVVITAPSRNEADAIASSQGLVFKKAPVFAPNSFVYEAETSASALAAQSAINDPKQVKVVALLAKQPAKLDMPNDPYVQLQWHLKYQGQQNAAAGTDINVESVWNYPSTTPGTYIRGNGTTIGIVDDSLEWSHPDLAANVLPDLQWDWNQDDRDPSPYYSSDAHGTAVAGVAAARGNNRRGVSGVAPEASLVGMRLISDPVTDLDEAEAMAWLPDQVHIKSNSWGYYPFSEDPDTGEFAGWNSIVKNGELADAALKYAADFGRDGKGTIITFAAGNHDEYLDATGAIVKSGARMDFADFQGSIYTIAVGAVSSQGVKSNYSQIGSALLISAPSNTTDGTGLGVMTTDNMGFYGYNGGGSLGDFPSSGDVTKTFGGTSSACPTVSGVIALMLEKNPDLGWRDVQEILIRSANYTFDAAGWETNGYGFRFNYNYGAGLVDAAAAVALSGNWTNLPAQTSNSVALGLTTPQNISAGATITRTFHVTTPIRAEHVTLAINIPDIKKGDLQIDLTSPAGTNSVFCEPHTDQLNSLEDWTFMTVRNWGETSTGFWKLTITNSGTGSGNLTAATLTVFGTPSANPPNPLPVVNLEAKRSFPKESGDFEAITISRAFVGTAITLSATITDKNSDGTNGSITNVEFFSNNGTGAVSIGNFTSSGNNSYSRIWSPAAVGNFTLTSTATDNGDLTSNATSVNATSSPVRVRIDPYPYAAWDFDTLEVDPDFDPNDPADDPARKVTLSTAIQSSRQYSANFGSNNGTIAKILFDGSLGSSAWNSNNGEIWTENGLDENSLADTNPFSTNAALVLRGGKNLSANNKSIVFQLNMTGARRLEISYATSRTVGGFNTHKWAYWDAKAESWKDIQDNFGNQTVAVSLGETEIVLDQVAGSGFNGRSDARVRLTVSGATAITGTNLLDNIRFNATVAP